MNNPKDLLEFIPNTATSSLKKISKIIPPFPKKKEELKKDERKNETFEYQLTKLIVLRNLDEKTVNSIDAEYNFHPIHLEDIISPLQRPKIDVEEKYIFFVLHFPRYNQVSNKLESVEMDFFLTENEVIVIANNLYQPFEDIISTLAKNQKKKNQYFSKGAGILLYNLIDKIFDNVFPALDLLDSGLEGIDQAVFANKSRHVIERLSLLRRNVIVFQTIIKPEMNSFLRLEEEKHTLLTRELKTYLSNITDHLKKIWDRLEDLDELSNNLSRTFETYVTYRTNEIIKILTIFSVILMPLNLVASIYGMNLTFLPLSEHPQAIIILGIWMGNIVVLMLMFFRFKRWI